MSHDLFLGFSKEPENLDEVLAQLGVQPDGNTFKFYDPNNSRNPIKFSYHGPIEDLEFWRRIEPRVKFEAHITCQGESQYDFDKHLELAKSIRDRYSAILIDQDSPEPITD